MTPYPFSWKQFAIAGDGAPCVSHVYVYMHVRHLTPADNQHKMHQSHNGHGVKPPALCYIGFFSNLSAKSPVLIKKINNMNKTRYDSGCLRAEN